VAGVVTTAARQHPEEKTLMLDIPYVEGGVKKHRLVWFVVMDSDRTC
jgi:hypothetical protein